MHLSKLVILRHHSTERCKVLWAQAALAWPHVLLHPGKQADPTAMQVFLFVQSGHGLRAQITAGRILLCFNFPWQRTSATRVCSAQQRSLLCRLEKSPRAALAEHAHLRTAAPPRFRRLGSHKGMSDAFLLQNKQ